jgi:anaerobic magnesium-protoporphyrin IX monomethyl ester cyclase
MGVADPSKRTRFGHDRLYITMPYLSLLYTAGVLERDGHAVTFLDAQVEDLDKEQTAERVRQYQPEIVVQLLNLPSLYGDLEIMKAVRERAAGVRTVAVGVVTIPLFDYIAESGAADAIVRGDPEVIVPSLLPILQGTSADGGRFEKHKGVLVNQQVFYVEDLDALPPVPYHLVPMEKYWYFPFGVGVPYATAFVSRGCSYRCYYCPYPMGFGGTIIHRNPARVIDEIEELYKKRGVQAVYFRDQVFTMDREKTLRLCDEILRRGLKLRWVVETRLDKVDEELLLKMKEAGCVRIHFGIESGDPDLFDKVGKDGAKGLLEQFFRNFEMVERVGIAAHMFILVGLLGETWNSVRKTIETVQRMKPLTLQVAVVTPYPGTGLFDQCKRKGLLSTEDLSKYTGFLPVSRTEAMSSEELLHARQMIIKAHSRAVFWKKKRRLVELTIRYARDGSLWRRLKRKCSHRTGTLLQPPRAARPQR